MTTTSCRVVALSERQGHAVHQFIKGTLPDGFCSFLFEYYVLSLIAPRWSFLVCSSAPLPRIFVRMPARCVPGLEALTQISNPLVFCERSARPEVLWEVGGWIMHT